MEEKQCKTCGEIKSVAAFHKDKGMKDGYKNYCRECYKLKIYSYEKQGYPTTRKSPPPKEKKQAREKRKSYIRKGYNPNSGKSGFIKAPKPIIARNGIEGKECNRCEEWKPLTEYHKFKRLAYGLNIYCKECDRVAKRNYFQSEKGRENSYSARTKRRSRMNNVEFTPFQRKAILDRDNWTCQKCGIKVHDRNTGEWNTPDKAHLDHIISLYDSGSSEPENIQTLCRTCNLSKGKKSESEAQLTFF